MAAGEDFGFVRVGQAPGSRSAQLDDVLVGGEKVGDTPYLLARDDGARHRVVYWSALGDGVHIQGAPGGAGRRVGEVEAEPVPGGGCPRGGQTLEDGPQRRGVVAGLVVPGTVAEAGDGMVGEPGRGVAEVPGGQLYRERVGLHVVTHGAHRETSRLAEEGRGRLMRERQLVRGSSVSVGGESGKRTGVVVPGDVVGFVGQGGQVKDLVHGEAGAMCGGAGMDGENEQSGPLAQFGGWRRGRARADPEGERAQGAGPGQTVFCEGIEVFGELGVGEVDGDVGAVVVAYGHVLAVVGQSVGGGFAGRGDGQGVCGPLVGGPVGEGVTGVGDQVCGIHGRFPFGRA
ncbi:hypothetical protein AB0A60_19220 [Streptomyces sp. NPDC046275]|uniref:hypothetical protein n=1 Tax=Streptomyces sp. NPDC046275 TaxID=3157201 RepID=UPI0033D57076